MKKSIVFWFSILACISLIAVSIFKRKEIEDVIGQSFYQRLMNVDLVHCVQGEPYIKTKKCLDELGQAYQVLGDTANGNFKIVVSKPFAESYVEVLDWKASSSGWGVRRTLKSHSCFLYQLSIPTLPEKDRLLMRRYAGPWFERNPEASQRQVIQVEETASEIKVHSRPLEQLHDYTEYCSEGVHMKYLDDRPNFHLDITIIDKQ